MPKRQLASAAPSFGPVARRAASPAFFEVLTMSMTFAGQVAVVTGAAAGIGRATAQAFAAEGLKVVAADLDVAGGEGTVQSIREAGGEALFVRCDVTLESDVQNLMSEVINTYGRLDYAFNNAEIGRASCRERVCQYV